MSWGGVIKEEAKVWAEFLSLYLWRFGGLITNRGRPTPLILQLCQLYSLMKRRWRLYLTTKEHVLTSHFSRGSSASCCNLLQLRNISCCPWMAWPHTSTLSQVSNRWKLTISNSCESLRLWISSSVCLQLCLCVFLKHVPVLFIPYSKFPQPLLEKVVILYLLVL